MQESIQWYSMISTLFFMTTVFFMLFSVLLIRRIGRLRYKAQLFREQIAEKNKLLAKQKENPLKWLKPYESESSKSIIISVDKKHRIKYVNDYAEELFGYSKEELLNKDVFKTICQEIEEDDSAQKNIIDRIFEHPKMYMEHECEHLKKNNDPVWIWWTNRVVYDETGKPIEIRSVGFDITKRKQLEYQLRSLSAYDSLTGVYNRQAFLDLGVKELKRAERYNRQLSLLIMRLDFFHGIESDKEFTDEILKDIIDVCQKSIRETDVIGRLNDIEFGILLPETPVENASFLAEQLKKKIQTRNMGQQCDFFLNASFGYAEKSNKDSTIDCLVSKAFLSLDKSEKSKTTARKHKGA